MTSIEAIIRPFAADTVTPEPFAKPGQVGTPPIHVTIGLKGGTKTFHYSSSATTATYMGQKHKEKAPNSDALKQAIGNSG